MTASVNPEIPAYDLHYLAGLVDGDGSIVAQLVKMTSFNNPSNIRPWQIRLSIQISQLSIRRDCLIEAQSIVGAGTVADQRLPSRMSQYQLVGADYVVAFGPQLCTHLRLKQNQCKLLVYIGKNLELVKFKSNNSGDYSEFYQLLLLVDRISGLNDSKIKKRIHSAQSAIDIMQERNAKGDVPSTQFMDILLEKIVAAECGADIF